MKENPYDHIDKDAFHIAALIAAYIRGTITEKEHDELDNWINASDNNMKLFEELTDESNISANLEWMDTVETERFSKFQEENKLSSSRAKRISRQIWMAAASIFLIAALFIIFRYMNNTNQPGEISKLENSEILPGGNRATLTLDNGRIIDLSSAKNGLIRENEGAEIIKAADGQLVYAGGEVQSIPGMHTLTTPVGGQFRLTLPDGTKVWLNAATTIRYPEWFTGDQRRVELNGEAYFEVAKNEKQPFLVTIPGETAISVLGTHFNVMSYPAENSKEITLLEGKVAVQHADQHALLAPGMQARIENGKLEHRSGADLEEVTGWKEGQFVFHDATIEQIMRQVERWYGAEVVYQDKVTFHFNATIDRSEPIHRLLHFLESTGHIRFKIQDKKIIVMK